MEKMGRVLIMSSIAEYLEREHPEVSIAEAQSRVPLIEKDLAEQSYLLWRLGYADLAVTQAALTHFGCPQLSAEELKDLFSRAVDMMVDYYHGDWWTPEKAAEWIAQHPPKNQAEEIDRLTDAGGSPEMDPAYKEAQDLDRGIIGNAMLTASFCGKFKELARICDWFDLRIEPGYCDGQVEDEYQLGILYLISRFRSEPIPGIEQVVKQIERCRHKRPRVFLKLINAAFDGDVEAYHEALPPSLELHHLRLDPGDITDLIAIEQSVLAEVARRNGMEPPPLKERAKHTLLTAESLGFC
jgi:hypothetical protein